MRLAKGKIRTVYQGQLVEDGKPVFDAFGAPVRWPASYRVLEDDRPNCIYCRECGVALAEAWRSNTRRGITWCTRGGTIGTVPLNFGFEAGMAVALRRARGMVIAEGTTCGCEGAA